MDPTGARDGHFGPSTLKPLSIAVRSSIVSLTMLSISSPAARSVRFSGISSSVTSGGRSTSWCPSSIPPTRRSRNRSRESDGVLPPRAPVGPVGPVGLSPPAIGKRRTSGPEIPRLGNRIVRPPHGPISCRPGRRPDTAPEGEATAVAQGESRGRRRRPGPCPAEAGISSRPGSSSRPRSGCRFPRGR